MTLGVMSYQELIDAVQDHAGLASRSEAQTTTLAVFRTIARRVLPGDRRIVRALLPDELQEAFNGQGASEDATIEAVVREVAAHEGIAAGFGREHLVVVGAAAARVLHPDAITALRTHLPDELAALFERSVPRRIPRPTPTASPRAGRRFSEAKDGSRHLAEARPGSGHPLAESKPERAHHDSVARTDNPHGDTKLSTTGGMTQSRAHETLSEGKE